MNRSRNFHRQFLRCFGGMLLTLFLLVGCTVGPDYQAVEPSAPEAWNTTLSGRLTAERSAAVQSQDWWLAFQDVQLEALISRALQGNLDLKQAGSRVREARALRGVAQATLYPEVEVGGSATRSRSSESSGSGTERDLYFAGFDASWEIDLFGGSRRTVEAAQASLEASQEALNDVLISLRAETALNYADVRINQARLAAVTGTIKILRQSYELNRSRFEAGLSSELPVQESLRLIEVANASIPALQAGVQTAKNRLAILLGLQPGQLDDELSKFRSLPQLPERVAVGIPAETLRQRPDVRRAERLLAQQTALVGVAVADLYPRLRLSGTLGLEALELSDLPLASSSKWSIGPGVQWNIFDAGAVRRNIAAQNERQQQQLLQYEQTVLTALGDVEGSLVAYSKELERKDSLGRALQAAERAEALASDQYQAGLVSYNNVLDAQRALLQLKDEWELSNGATFTSLVRLYKSLGGGWQVLEQD